jgi:hypothetical protein
MKRIALLPIFALLVVGGVVAGNATDGEKETPPALRPGADLVTDLDRAIQTRFQTVRDEDIKNGRLGVSRMIDFRSPHGLTLRPENKEERSAADRLKAAGWVSALYVGASGPLGGLRGEVTGPITAGENSLKGPEDKKPFRELARRAITENAAIHSGTEDLILEARPVLLSGASCIGCHRGRKIGDPLGAVVYAFRRDVSP